MLDRVRQVMFVVPWNFSAGKNQYLAFRYIDCFWLFKGCTFQPVFVSLLLATVYVLLGICKLALKANIYRYPRHLHYGREIDYFYAEIVQCTWPDLLKWVKISLISYSEKQERSFTGHIANRLPQFFFFFLVSFLCTKKQKSIALVEHLDLLCTNSLTVQLSPSIQLAKAHGKYWWKTWHKQWPTLALWWQWKIVLLRKRASSSDHYMVTKRLQEGLNTCSAWCFISLPPQRWMFVYECPAGRQHSTELCVLAVPEIIPAELLQKRGQGSLPQPTDAYPNLLKGCIPRFVCTTPPEVKSHWTEPSQSKASGYLTVTH